MQRLHVAKQDITLTISQLQIQNTLKFHFEFTSKNMGL